MVEFTGQLLATFPTVLYFFGLIARLIPHFAERGKPDIRSVIQSLDESFVFNLVIDSFTLSVIDGLILIFQFGTIASGFISLFTGVALCVLAFSFLRAHSLGGSISHFCF